MRCSAINSTTGTRCQQTHQCYLKTVDIDGEEKYLCGRHYSLWNDGYDISICSDESRKILPDWLLHPTKTSTPELRLTDEVRKNYGFCVACKKSKLSADMNRFPDKVGNYHDVCDDCERDWKKENQRIQSDVSQKKEVVPEKKKEVVLFTVSNGKGAIPTIFKLIY